MRILFIGALGFVAAACLNGGGSGSEGDGDGDIDFEQFEGGTSGTSSAPGSDSSPFGCGLNCTPMTTSTGGGLQPGDSTPLNELDASGRQNLCQWIASNSMDGREVDCGDGITASQQALTVSECLSDFPEFGPSCGATVRDLKTCLEATDQDPCGFIDGNNSACREFIDCLRDEEPQFESSSPSPR